MLLLSRIKVHYEQHALRGLLWGLGVVSRRFLLSHLLGRLVVQLQAVVPFLLSDLLELSFFALLVGHVFAGGILFVDHEWVHAIELSKVEEELEIVGLLILLVVKLVHAEVEYEEAHLLAEPEQALVLVPLL